jgi:hypothetical protein
LREVTTLIILIKIFTSHISTFQMCGLEPKALEETNTTHFQKSRRITMHFMKMIQPRQRRLTHMAYELIQ